MVRLVVRNQERDEEQKVGQLKGGVIIAMPFDAFLEWKFRKSIEIQEFDENSHRK